MTRVGLFVISLFSGSRMEERLVGVGSFLIKKENVFKRNLTVSLGFNISMAGRDEPYLL